MTLRAAASACRAPSRWAFRVPSSPMRAAPLPGEHDEAVYGGLLGLSAQEIAALREEGVIR